MADLVTGSFFQLPNTFQMRLLCEKTEFVWIINIVYIYLLLAMPIIVFRPI